MLLFERPQHVPDFSIFSEDLIVADARLPGFELKGLSTYQRILSTLRWSLSTAFEHSKFQVTAVQPPVHGALQMRWRIHLWPKDVLAQAKDFLTPALGPGAFTSEGLNGDAPVIVEGYSRYEFDHWTAEIVKHTIDITNPPMLLADLVRERTGSFVWMPTPSVSGVRLPNMMSESDAEPELLQTTAAWSPSLPQTCESDFDCNDGRANFPLQCCELPILGKFCCEPEEIQSRPQDPAYVPLPVPSDPWMET